MQTYFYTFEDPITKTEIEVEYTRDWILDNNACIVTILKSWNDTTVREIKLTFDLEEQICKEISKLPYEGEDDDYVH